MGFFKNTVYKLAQGTTQPVPCQGPATLPNSGQIFNSREQGAGAGGSLDPRPAPCLAI